MAGSSLSPHDVPRDSEVVELRYRLGRREETYLDLLIAEPHGERCLRFREPRVVQIDKDLPDALRGLEVQDIRERKLGALTLWVSVAEGAVTFWAKALSELKQPTAARVPMQPGPIDIERLRPWDLDGVPRGSFLHRTPGATRGGVLRIFSISTRPYGS